MIYPNSGLRNHLCEEAPRQKAAESRKIPELGSVIPREGVESEIEESEHGLVGRGPSDPERGS